MRTLDAALVAWRLFRQLCHASPESLSYFALERYGVPEVVVVASHGRTAWQLCQFATNYFAGPGWKPAAPTALKQPEAKHGRR